MSLSASEQWFVATGGAGGSTGALVAAAGGNAYYHFIVETGGTATNWGNQIAQAAGTATYASETTGFAACGAFGIDNINAFSFATSGNATDFGDATEAGDGPDGCQNATRGVMMGRWNGYSTATSSVVDYVTMATAGNATSFGTNYSHYNSGSASNDTTCLYGGGGYWPGSGNMSPISTCSQLTMATTGSAATFTSNISATYYRHMPSNSTRAMHGGGGGQNLMQYWAFSSPGNATDFGDTTTPRSSGMDNGITGIMVGGTTTTSDQLTIATPANATSFSATFATDIGTYSNSMNSFVSKP